MLQSYLKEILSYDKKTGIFRWKIDRSKVKANSVAGCVGTGGYIQIKVNYKLYKAHRLAWLYVHGEFPKEQIDHINHNRKDNRLSNLRVVSNVENHRNIRMLKNNTSGVSGVYWSDTMKKWHARIRVYGKQKNLGFFSDLDEAKKAREVAKAKYKFHPNHS